MRKILQITKYKDKLFKRQDRNWRGLFKDQYPWWDKEFPHRFRIISRWWKHNYQEMSLLSNVQLYLHKRRFHSKDPCPQDRKLSTKSASKTMGLLKIYLNKDNSIRSLQILTLWIITWPMFKGNTSFHCLK